MADTYMKDMVTNIKTLVEMTKENIKETKKDKDKENVDEKKDRIKAERDFKKLNSEIKNPSSPMNKFYIKMMQTSLGKMTVGFLKTSSYHVKTYYGKMAAIASGLFNRMFGKILDDLTPFLDAFKATASFLINVTKDLAKGIASITLSILKFPITLTKFMYSIGSTVFNFLKPKKDTPEVKVAKKQLSVETKILRILGKQTRYLGWIEKNTASSYVTGALGARKYGRIKKAFKGGIDVGTNTTGVLGTAAGAVGSVAGAAGSVIGGGLGLIGNVAGFFAKMIPYIGGFLAPLIATGVPIILGASIFRGLWEKFKETEAGQWVDKKIWQPLKKNIGDWWEKDGKGYAYDFGQLIWKGFMSLMPEWLQLISGKRENDIQDYSNKQTGDEKNASENKLIRRQILVGIGKALGITGGALTALGAGAGTGGVGLLATGSLMAGGSMMGTYGAEKLADWLDGDAYINKIQSRKDGGAVPIMAHEGEFVVKKDSAKKIGYDKMRYINKKGELPSYEEGDEVKKRTSAMGLDPIGSYKKAFNWFKSTNTAPISTTAAKPENYSSAEIEKMLKNYFGDQWQTMAKIMIAESGGYMDARRSSNWNNPESGDFGLFQINAQAWKRQLLKEGIITESMRELFNPETNMKAAKFILEKQGLSAWKNSEKMWSQDRKVDLKFKKDFKRGHISSPFSQLGEGGDSLFGNLWDMMGSLGSLATSIFKELLTAMGMLEPETLGSKTSGSSRTGRAVASSADYLKEIPLLNSLGNDMAMRETGAYSAGAANTIIINSGGSDDRLKTLGIMPSTSQLQSLVPSI